MLTGSSRAPIEVVLFSDVECPFCRKFHLHLKELMDDFPDKLKLIYKNYPLDHDCNPFISEPYHLNSCFAAHLARCAGEQGRYWEALDILYTLPIFQEDLPPGRLRRRVVETISSNSLDKKALNECMQSKRHRPRIVKDIRQGEKLGIRGTPSVFVNGKQAPPSKVALKNLFESLLAEGNAVNQLGGAARR